MIRSTIVSGSQRFGPVLVIVTMLLVFALVRLGDAQEPSRALPEGATKTEPESSGAKVEKIGDHRYRLGKIEFDSRSRELRLPVMVNQCEGGPMEYLLVHEQGKVHESILTTSASPLHLQIALKLLHYREESGDLFARIGLPRLTRPLRGGETSSSLDALGDAIAFFFQPDGGIEIPACELVLDQETGHAMTPDCWIYTGSAVFDGQFLAENTGSMIAIYLDPAAQFNMTRSGAEIDERWNANRDAIPAVGTKGTLIVRPYSSPEDRGEEKTSVSSP